MAVAYLKKQGGIRSRAFLKLTFRILKSADKVRVSLISRHITGHLNVLADLASTVGQAVPSEWALCESAMQCIANRSSWKRPRTDLFANSSNPRRLERYILYCPDSDAVGVNALECQWPAEVQCTFPPTCLLHPLLKRLRGEYSFKSCGLDLVHENQEYFNCTYHVSKGPDKISGLLG